LRSIGFGVDKLIAISPCSEILLSMLFEIAYFSRLK